MWQRCTFHECPEVPSIDGVGPSIFYARAMHEVYGPAMNARSPARPLSYFVCCMLYYGFNKYGLFVLSNEGYMFSVRNLHSSKSSVL